MLLRPGNGRIVDVRTGITRRTPLVVLITVTVPVTVAQTGQQLPVHVHHVVRFRVELKRIIQPTDRNHLAMWDTANDR
uniref:Putative secreted protein n=1 Tax=Anopheles marajoara TaxID=58244 RepID=A0A2M4CCH3_9DIPT